MKLIHCADLHLDSSMDTHLSKELARVRRDELLKTFLRMVDYAVAEQVQAILIAGDLFDKRRINATPRNTVLAAIKEHPGITFFYVTGNHERDGFLSSLTEIPANLKLFGPMEGSTALPASVIRPSFSSRRTRSLFLSVQGLPF